MFDLDAYLTRIGLDGELEAAAIHRAHVSAIPFENLDPHRGVPVSLRSDALELKLVGARRGGYCFEQNLLLKAALEELGATVEPMLARVRWNAPPGAMRPLSHLVLRVSLGGAVWHADVGFGAGTLLEPIPFGAGGPYEQSGWRFRVLEEQGELVLQTWSEDRWRDVYAFFPEPVPQIDIEVSNWFTCTHPESRFVTGLIVCSHRADGTRLVLSDFGELSLIEQAPAASTVTPVSIEDVPGLLSERFGLPGFELTEAGRLDLAPSGAGGLHRDASVS